MHSGRSLFLFYAMKIEERIYTVPEFRLQSEESRTIAGYAAVFNARSQPIFGLFVEEILPGAFADSIRQDDIFAYWHHESSQVLGRAASKTLRLTEDDHGLRVEIDLPETTDGNDALTLIRRRDVSQMSFAFSVERDEDEIWKRIDGGMRLRQVKRAKLYEVSPVTHPAYRQTEIGARSEMRSVYEQKLRDLDKAELPPFDEHEFLYRSRKLDLISKGLAL